MKAAIAVTCGATLLLQAKADDLKRSGAVVYLPGDAEADLGWDAMAGYEEQKSEVEDLVLMSITHADAYADMAKRTRKAGTSQRPKVCVLKPLFAPPVLAISAMWATPPTWMRHYTEFRRPTCICNHTPRCDRCACHVPVVRRRCCLRAHQERARRLVRASLHRRRPSRLCTFLWRALQASGTARARRCSVACSARRRAWAAASSSLTRCGAFLLHTCERTRLCVGAQRLCLGASYEAICLTNGLRFKRAARLRAFRGKPVHMRLLPMQVDSLATSRGDDMNEATRRLLGVLLRFIDGFKATDSIVVAATNRKQDLDAALLSRCDSIVTFDLPTEDVRAAILKHYAAHLSTEVRR